jgi:hypothetical protein
MLTSSQSVSDTGKVARRKSLVSQGSMRQNTFHRACLHRSRRDVKGALQTDSPRVEKAYPDRYNLETIQSALMSSHSKLHHHVPHRCHQSAS